MKRLSLSDVIAARSFVVAIQLFRGSTVGELGMLLDELCESHGDLALIEGGVPD